VLIKDGRMKPDGQIIIVGEGPVVEHDTKQCCHCGGHFVIRPRLGHAPRLVHALPGRHLRRRALLGMPAARQARRRRRSIAVSHA
jgi:hypothetical protein